MDSYDYISRKGFVGEGRSSKFMHHPIRFNPFGRSSSIKHKGFLQTNTFGGIGRVNRPIGASGLPKSASCYPVRPCTVPVFTVSWAVEIQLFLARCC